MAVDTPATIAIIGAGPIGLEAALYARFLGYDVLVFEQGLVAESVQRWGHVEMFTPFSMNCSPLGVAAIQAQGSTELPSEDQLLTGCQWRTRYLIPLSQTDLLADSIHQRTNVVIVGRQSVLKHEMPGAAERATSRFRILVDGVNGEAVHQADIVIDCSGVLGVANWLGSGGGPAVGERALIDHIDHLPPDVLGKDKSRFEGMKTLLVGAGYSAATTAVELSRLVVANSETQFVWAVRAVETHTPITRHANDRLASRDQLAQTANALASQADGPCRMRGETCIESIRREDQGAFWIRFYGQDAEESFDNLVANVGFCGDNTITDQLQVHRCYASDGPMNLAATLSQQTTADCLDQKSTGADSLKNPEPNLYLLGSKSYARNPSFLFAVGLEQIRDLFTLIGDRETLDLYATVGTARS
jgi:hypothetical protein